MKEITEEKIRLLKTLADHFDLEDKAVRERQIRTWRRLKYFWEGFQRVWYSEVAHDWRVWDQQESSDETDQATYDKPINVFRAYLESIIAALSITVPPVKCYPDDADNPLDLMTAKAGDKIGELIYRHNNVPLLWIHSLYIYCTEGMVACYSYPKEDEKNGTYEVKRTKDEDEIHYKSTCPSCGYLFNDTIDPDEFQPELNGDEICPECEAQVTPDTSQETLTVEKIVGIGKKAKSRMCLESYGGLYVKVPVYAKAQKDIPYLRLAYETHFSNARARYERIRGKIQPMSGGAWEPYEKWGRLSPQYQGEYPIHNVTVSHYWIRPDAFYTLEDSKERDELLKDFPIGVKLTKVNDEFAEVEAESLDDCWTLTYNPLSDFLHHDPIGLLVTSIQEITNDLVSLIIQTIEHGIPQTFADPASLDFEQYRQTEVAPGLVFPAKAKSGKTLGDSFHEVKTAALSAEVLPFLENIQSFGQLVSGAIPSLFGGQLGDNKTASVYSMSRQAALQRIGNIWKVFTFWWKEIHGKVIPAQIKEIHEDERNVEKDRYGNFINTFIRKAELEGRIGRIELEANENLPITYNQMRDFVQQLLTSNNPQALSFIMDPENLPILRESFGMTDFHIDGEDDRNKQYEEISELLDSEPITVPPDDMAIMAAIEQGLPEPQETEQSSVEVDPDIDRHDIEFDICRKWAVSEAGRLAKIENEPGYRNVLLHAKEHLMFLRQQQMAMTPEPGAKGARPKETDQEAPIQGERNVQTES